MRRRNLLKKPASEKILCSFVDGYLLSFNDLSDDAWWAVAEEAVESFNDTFSEFLPIEPNEGVHMYLRWKEKQKKEK